MSTWRLFSKNASRVFWTNILYQKLVFIRSPHSEWHIQQYKYHHQFNIHIPSTESKYQRAENRMFHFAQIWLPKTLEITMSNKKKLRAIEYNIRDADVRDNMFMWKKKCVTQRMRCARVNTRRCAEAVMPVCTCGYYIRVNKNDDANARFRGGSFFFYRFISVACEMLTRWYWRWQYITVLFF